MKKISVLIMFLAFLGFQMVQAQTRQITGTVTNSEDGTTLPGVQIIVVSTTIGTITDLDGNYSLTVPETARTLRFSFVGMKTVDVALVGQAIIDVVMESDLLALDEVIVVSYGTATRESFTGAATVVDSETLGKRQVSSVKQYWSARYKCKYKDTWCGII